MNTPIKDHELCEHGYTRSLCSKCSRFSNQKSKLIDDADDLLGRVLGHFNRGAAVDSDKDKVLRADLWKWREAYEALRREAVKFADETKAPTTEFVWRWIDRMARNEISIDEALSVLTHHPDAPDWVVEYKIIRPEEPTIKSNNTI